MYVNIGYTVKFEDVPKTVDKMISDDISASVVEGVLEKIYVATDAIRDQNVDKAIQLVDEARKSLILIDAQLSNCFDILSGYLKERLGVETGASPPPVPTNNELASLQNLQKEVTSLKEGLEQLDIGEE